MAVASKRYRSFISYSQQDKAWGRRLHTWLESYRVPIGVIAEVQEGRRLGRFFRDEAEMPAAPDIGEVVREAIETAESLIVVCSPRSAHSKWVAAEIAHFRKTNPEGKLFAVVIDGVANSADPATECFPAALRRSSLTGDSMPVEPVGVDARVDSKDRICARLASGLLDVDFDDLWQRDRRRLERRQRNTMFALASVSLVFAALAAAAIWFALLARSQTQAAEAARLNLQQEYLTVLGESGIDDVLTNDLIPGVLEADDEAAWTRLMERGDGPFLLAREYGRGRMIAAAHDGLLDADRVQHGDAFLRRALGWLKGPEGRLDVVISSGHCEWMAIGVEDWPLPDLMRGWGYTVRDGPAPLTDAALAKAGVLIIGNAWGAFQPGEVAAIERFVRGGGGLLAAGLGWSWLEHSGKIAMPCPMPSGLGVGAQTLAAYPMNALGKRFGIAWTKD
jgi:hypothetical protein